jgi:aerobic-type carbon monoxide dehydrogenase small subunit (CoxS/CutS family)
VLASATAGKKISTIEGLATGGKLHPFRKHSYKKERFQCGGCTDTRARIPAVQFNNQAVAVKVLLGIPL